MGNVDKSRDSRQEIYEYFLALNLESLPLKSNNLSLHNYLSFFEYPGRTKLKKPEAIAVCLSFKAAIQAGWTDDVMTLNGKVGRYWIPPNGDSTNALSPKEVSDRFRQPV